MAHQKGIIKQDPQSKTNQSQRAAVKAFGFTKNSNDVGPGAKNLLKSNQQAESKVNSLKTEGGH